MTDALIPVECPFLEYFIDPEEQFIVDNPCMGSLDVEFCEQNPVLSLSRRERIGWIRLVELMVLNPLLILLWLAAAIRVLKEQGMPDALSQSVMAAVFSPLLNF